MSVYKFFASEECDVLVPVNQNDWEIVSSLDGRKTQLSWTPLAVSKTSINPRLYPYGSDFLYLSSNAPVVSMKAWRALKKCTEKYVEPLTVISNDSEYVLLNVTEVIKAIDTYKSIIDYHEDDKRIVYGIDKYEMKRNIYSGIPIFRDAVCPLLEVYVTDTVISIIEEYGLTGFTTKCIYS